MQPNVVPSPQVAAPQVSNIQPQQTPALPTNEQPETQTPNQEPFSVSISVVGYFIYFGYMCMLLGNLLFGDGHYFGVLDKMMVSRFLNL